MTSTALRIGVLDGDDIGHEIVPASVEIARAAADMHGVAIDWHPLPIGARALETHGHTLPEGTMATLQDPGRLDPRADRAPRLPEGAERDQPAPDPAQVSSTCSPTCGRRARIPDIGCLHDGVDLVIVRENNEGFQPDRNMVMGSGNSGRPTR